VKVLDLVPGDLIRNVDREALYVEQAPHPLYRGMQLVIWKLADGTWSLDALYIYQETGELVEPTDWPARKRRLEEALLGSKPVAS
jgi:hypothetical protein